MKVSIIHVWLALACCTVSSYGQVGVGSVGSQDRATTPSIAPPRAPDIEPTGSIDINVPTTCNANTLAPWSATFSADGSGLYVSLFGGFIGSGACEVLRLDGETGAVTDHIPVDEGPLEIALRRTPQGGVLQGFVTCSSGSSVAVFDGMNQFVTSIPLPPDPSSSFGTAFPFGLVVDEARGVVWVGTNDSSGRVFAIDIPTLTLDLGRSLQLGLERSTARMALFQGELIIPAFRFTPTFTGSTAELVFIDPDNPSAADAVLITTSDGQAAFPSPQEVGITSDGRALVAGFDLGRRIHVIDIPTRTLLAPFPTFTSTFLGKYQGLRISPDGLVVVIDFWSNEVARLNSVGGVFFGVTDPGELIGNHSGLTAAVFRPDGTELILVGKGTNSLARLSVQ